MDTWVEQGILKNFPKHLQKHYQARQQEVKSKLWLTYVRFTPEEAEKAWTELRHHEVLFEQIEIWSKAGWVKSGFLPRYYARLLELQARLEGNDRPQTEVSPPTRLDELSFLEEAVQRLILRGDFSSLTAQGKVLSQLSAEKSQLESALRPPVKKEAERPIQKKETATLSPHPETVPAVPAPPRPPLRERLWRSILSERTLQALLFLGIFLLFVAAVSFVVWGWEDFPPPVRVAIPFGFTALFFVLGQVVRTKTHLDRSALALSAIAALLIPIDSYTIYANYGSPPAGWAEFWLITSLACLIAYILSALYIQSRFFGYITGLAAGSTLLSLIEVTTDISRDWYSAAISILAVVMIILGTRISHHPRPGRWQVFADPFRYLALWIPAAAMPLTLGLRLITRDTFDTLHYAMSVNWFLGGFIFGWGAIYHRSRSLGILAAITLPISVYMAQGAIFYHADINPAWHALGLTCLTPLYVFTGYKLSSFKDDEVLSSHGHTATRWGTALIIIAALLSLTDLHSGTAAAVSHGVLVFSTALSAMLWQKPRSLYGTSFFSFTASTFAMTELNLNLNQVGVGWASLAILHILLVLRLSRPSPNLEHRTPFLRTLVIAAYFIAVLSILPPLFLYEGQLLAYALGNWIALSAWGAYLAHRGQVGFNPLQPVEKPRLFKDLINTGAIYHWLASLPLPFWVWIVNRNNEFPDYVLPLLLIGLAWLMVLLSHRLNSVAREFYLPWRLTGLTVSVVALMIAFANASDGYVLPITLLAAGVLYFTDTLLSQERLGFYPAGLVTAWGLWHILDHAEVNNEVITFALCFLVAIYFIAGLEAERRKLSFGRYDFLAPLYHTAHLIALIVLARIYFNFLLDIIGAEEWTDTQQLWGAADQLLLGVIYGIFAWGRYQEFWGHIAAWLGMAGGGFIAIIYSRGHGSLAAKGAIIAVLMVFVERGLNHLRRSASLQRHRRAFFQLAWGLYKRPLLIAGWTASVAIIVLALVRNLILLGGGRIQQTWAAIGLLIITALYALSARLFQKARFVWFAVIVVFAPWTIITNLGWFTAFKPSLPDFAVSWTALAWILFLTGLLIASRAPFAYAKPLKTATYILLPFSILWAIANTDASLYTVGLSIALYAVSAWLNHKQTQTTSDNLSPLTATKFLYPALGLIPLWSVYWLDYLSPNALHEHFGLLILTFGVLGLATGIFLERIAPRPELKRAYGLPAYLTGYIAIMIGTMMVAHVQNMVAAALLYDALLMATSAWLFRSSLWLYPATSLTALSLIIALNESNVPAERQGWWLIGLAAVYLVGAWVLRRAQSDSYASVLIIAGFAVTALGLPPSSLDQTGAIWGYGAAALLYAVCAFWLHQPLLLTPASLLIVVPYAALIQRSSIPLQYQGLSLFPGAVLVVAAGLALDRRFGSLASLQGRWFTKLVNRFLNWWALPLYILGLGLATVAPFFTDSNSGQIALNFLLLASFYGWAVYRFQSRFWLLTALLTTHFSLGFYLDTFGLWRTAAEAEAWLRFIPLTTLMLASGLFVERRLNEGSPLHIQRLFVGWSRPFYLFVLIDVLFSQLGSVGGTFAGAWVSIINMLIIAALASLWSAPILSYVSAFLGFSALVQWREAADWLNINLPVHYAALALGYGALGFGYTLLKAYTGSGEGDVASHPVRSWYSVWEVPLQRSAIILSILSLGIGTILGVDIARWSVRAFFGTSFRQIVDTETVYMAVWVLSLIGLLYIAASAVYKRVRLSYLAFGMLMAGWFLYAYYINAWDNLRQLQWYALPAGLYLLGIGFVEWTRSNKPFARWLDYMAMLLMLGSLFWQTLSFGWLFALLLGSEGFAAFWWGSARRLRRFFYAGMAGVVLAGLGQLLNALQEVNQWITFGLIGLVLVILAIIVERRLETIKAWQQVLETWE
ncbi:MAG: hypothetical protein IPP66_15515 [Anaerolineales bacterium]|nr:hypothetical protein [Anaerolineales bacterium]